jgi:hypothetical protein
MGGNSSFLYLWLWKTCQKYSNRSTTPWDFRVPIDPKVRNRRSSGLDTRFNECWRFVLVHRLWLRSSAPNVAKSTTTEDCSWRSLWTREVQ